MTSGPGAESTRVVRASCRHLVGRESELAQRFQAHLLSLESPDDPLFPPHGRVNPQEVLHAILSAIDRTVDVEEIGHRLEELGARNHRNGFRDDGYQTVGHALVRAVRDVYAGDWSSALSSSWMAFHAWTATHLTAGAEAARLASTGNRSLLPFPDDGFGQTPDDGYGQAPDDGYGQASDGAFGHAPDSAFGHAPDGGYGRAPDGGFGQAPDSGYGQASDDAYERRALLDGWDAEPARAPVTGSSPVQAADPWAQTQEGGRTASGGGSWAPADGHGWSESESEPQARSRGTEVPEAGSPGSRTGRRALHRDPLLPGDPTSPREPTPHRDPTPSDTGRLFRRQPEEYLGSPTVEMPVVERGPSLVAGPVRASGGEFLPAPGPLAMTGLRTTTGPGPMTGPEMRHGGTATDGSMPGVADPRDMWPGDRIWEVPPGPAVPRESGPAAPRDPGPAPVPWDPAGPEAPGARRPRAGAPPIPDTSSVPAVVDWITSWGRRSGREDQVPVASDGLPASDGPPVVTPYGDLPQTHDPIAGPAAGTGQVRVSGQGPAHLHEHLQGDGWSTGAFPGPSGAGEPELSSGAPPAVASGYPEEGQPTEPEYPAREDDQEDGPRYPPQVSAVAGFFGRMRAAGSRGGPEPAYEDEEPDPVRDLTRDLVDEIADSSWRRRGKRRASRSDDGF